MTDTPALGASAEVGFMAVTPAPVLYVDRNAVGDLQNDFSLREGTFDDR